MKFLKQLSDKKAEYNKKIDERRNKQLTLLKAKNKEEAKRLAIKKAFDKEKKIAYDRSNKKKLFDFGKKAIKEYSKYSKKRIAKPKKKRIAKRNNAQTIIFKIK